MSSVIAYAGLKMGRGLEQLLRSLPVKLDVNTTILTWSLIISAVIGFALLVQGISGLRTCRNHTAGQARRHAMRARKCAFFFVFLYIVKVLLDIELTSDVGDSLEGQVDQLPKLVEQYNKAHLKPKMVIMYNNGTVLFASKQLSCLQDLQSTSRTSQDGKHKRTQFDWAENQDDDDSIRPPPSPNEDEGSDGPSRHHEHNDKGSHKLSPRPQNEDEEQSALPKPRPGFEPNIQIPPPPQDEKEPNMQLIYPGRGQGNVKNEFREDSRRLWGWRKEHEQSGSSSGQYRGKSHNSQTEGDRHGQDDKHEKNRGKGKSRSKNMNVPVYYCEQDKTLVLRADMIKGHVKELLVNFYMMIAAFNIIAFLLTCCCLMCCNRKYKEACESKLSLMLTHDRVQRAPWTSAWTSSARMAETAQRGEQ